jgi:hypothetical protein
MAVDQQAEKAVRQAMRDLERRRRPLNSYSVPQRSSEILNDPNNPERIYSAIDEMTNRGDIVAPKDPWEPWHLIR